MGDHPGKTHMRDPLVLGQEEEAESMGSHGFGGGYWVDQLPRGQEYWQGRRAFLSSYRFSDDRSRLSGRLRKSVKGVNEAAMGVVLEVRQELLKRKLVVRVFRVRLTFPSMVRVCVRFFVPSLRKVEGGNRGVTRGSMF
ncbi:hypothetical protein SAY86_004612 [Trapa natans]|uniref:Uncharacterized protein n=1 Tax=Trapa natans TaxID=22666 RepID=A0AAN7MES2_TRANT|nr:hypothetical protein SAY86_004612 [Trapa natans]